MQTKRLLFADLTRSGLPKSKFQTEAHIEKTTLLVMNL